MPGIRSPSPPERACHGCHLPGRNLAGINAKNKTTIWGMFRWVRSLWDLGGLLAEADKRIKALLAWGGGVLLAVVVVWIVFGPIWAALLICALALMTWGALGWFEWQRESRAPRVPHTKGCRARQIEHYRSEIGPSGSGGITRTARCLDCGQHGFEHVPAERLTSEELVVTAADVVADIRLLVTTVRDAPLPLDTVLAGSPEAAAEAWKRGEQRNAELAYDRHHRQRVAWVYAEMHSRGVVNRFLDGMSTEKHRFRGLSRVADELEVAARKLKDRSGE
jgi:hypothetical protein